MSKVVEVKGLFNKEITPFAILNLFANYGNIEKIILLNL